MRRLHLLALIALTAVGVLTNAVSASAAQSDAFVFKSSFNGGGVLTEPGPIAVNHQTGHVFIINQGAIYQFDANGNPVDFPASGAPQIPVEGYGGGFSGFPGSLVVDNTGGPTQGNIYLIAGGFWAFEPDGTQIGGGAPFDGICGGGVAPNGNVLIGLFYSATVVEVTPAGGSTGKEFQLPGEYLSPACPVLSGDVSGEAGIYVPRFAFPDLPVHGYAFGPGSGVTDLGETGLVGFINAFVDMRPDPATGDIYINGQNSAGTEDKLLAIHRTNPLVKSVPFEALRGLKRVRGFDFDASGQTVYVSEGSRVDIFHREPPSPPYGLETPTVDSIRSQGANAHGRFVAAGAQTAFSFEYGTDTSYGQATPPTKVPFEHFGTKVDAPLVGLQPNTTYHVRLAATNSAGTTYGPDHTFTTYPVPPGDPDPCPNALARKQTGARRLPDCRAYELVSASNTGGYDVESSLVAGQTPFPGFPLATGRLLYATHSGAIPGPWNATNKGPDPYLATRTAGGWSTNYLGLPSDINPQAGSFSSVLGEADSSLGTLAFAGQNLCDPCFGSGLKTGIPVRLPSGQLVQGMSGSLAGSVPASAKPEGKVAKYFSGDGKHLLFASKYAFEPGANTGGDLTVYERDLGAGTTEIVSTDPSGKALTGTVSELDVSADGSRVVTGKRVSVDSAGNEYLHPYLHIAGSANGVDLAPGTTSGVLFAGMSADGSKVFFTSADKLVAGDTDASVDLFEAAVDSSGNLDLALVTGTNSDACNPVSNSNGAHWNTTGAGADCGTVAISGGGGVASASGAVYFLSPESLGGEGTPNQPNLYRDAGGALSFVATLEPNNPLVLDSVQANATRRTGDFQVTADGRFAVFLSDLPLTGVGNFGFRSVFRHDASSGQMACVSCDPTGTSDASLAANAELAPDGLSLLADGRAFFTTKAALVLNDANARRDVYQWSGGSPLLISAGTGPFDSALLTVSADGTDAFFFTHDVLAPEEDRNGTLTKVYDAREGGGFFKLPAEVPCAASDECHGPGTVAPGPPNIKSSGPTTAGNVLVCAKNRVKKRGQCVKKAVPRKKKKAKKHVKKRSAEKRNAGTTGKAGGRHA